MKYRVLTEDELDAEFHVKARLASGGNYGCNCVVFDGDIVLEGPIVLEDNFFYELNEPTEGDVSTILFNGNLTCEGHACISDRLMCLIILGDFKAKELSIFETEVLVCGNLDVGTLVDTDRLLRVVK